MKPIVYVCDQPDCASVMVLHRDDRLPKTWTCACCEDALLEQAMHALDTAPPDPDPPPFAFDRPIRRIADF